MGLVLTVLRPLHGRLCSLLGLRATLDELRNIVRVFSCWRQPLWDHWRVERSMQLLQSVGFAPSPISATPHLLL